MPDVQQYLKGFDLQLDMTFGGYKLTKLSCDHVQVKLWNEYSYPTDITFEWIGLAGKTALPTKNDLQKLLVNFTAYTDGYKIIRSDSGRPYKCVFMWPIGTAGTATYESEKGHEYTSINLKYAGRAKRISESEAQMIQKGESGNPWK
jgi:hypothetical protein